MNSAKAHLTIPTTLDGCLDMLADLTQQQWPGSDWAVERRALADGYRTHGLAANAIAYHIALDFGKAAPHLAAEAAKYITASDRKSIRRAG